MPRPELALLQSVVRSSGLDGWLLYDFRGLNPFPAQLLNLGQEILSRRWFLFVPAQGSATLIHHRIEASGWLQLLPDKTVQRKAFTTYQELDQALRETLMDSRQIAMEISPRGMVPSVSYIDAGTAEHIRECGVEIVSSENLMQQFMTWSEEDYQAHLRAVEGVIRAKDAGFRLIDEQLAARQPVTEMDVQNVIVQQLAHAGLEFDHPAIVAFGNHTSEGHYGVSPQSNRSLEMGMSIILDIWAGVRDRPMADITWVGFAGEPTAEYMRVWETVRDARDLAVDLLVKKGVAEGWQVDRAARDLIAARGYGTAFRHRLGHSLGKNQAHGPCVNLDDLETHDTRKLLPGLAVTVEPGVYLGHIGVRSEVNVLITESGATVTTPIQREPYRLG